MHSIAALVLIGLLHFILVPAQNLTAYYNQSCSGQVCNKAMKPVTENYVYVLLICIDARCLCPNKYELYGKPLNATGYEWREEHGQCLMSLNSECTGIAKGLCASGNCAQGICSNKTISRDQRDVKEETTPTTPMKSGANLCGVLYFSTFLSFLFAIVAH